MMRNRATFDTFTDHGVLPRRRFGYTEVLLVVAILALGAFTLINDGRLSLGTLLSGVGQVIGG
jgi:hypothetical protein